MWYWYPLLLMSTAYTLLLFPDGLPSRRWRPVLLVLTIGLAAMVVTAALAPTIDYGKANVPNPIGVASGWKDVESSPVFNVAGIVLAACLLASVASLGVRFRRARGLERAQLKWFFLGASFLGVVLLASLFSRSFNNSSANDVLAPFVFMSMPLACGVAILRYRLYDIDVIIRRTLVYSLLTLILGLIYIGCIVLSRTLVAPLIGGSEVAIVASTLVIAALFNPLRRGIQNVIDRRFYRRKYDAAKVLAAFGTTARDETDLSHLTSELLRVVDATMQPEFVGLWLRETPALSLPERARPDSLSPP